MRALPITELSQDVCARLVTTHAVMVLAASLSGEAQEYENFTPKHQVLVSCPRQTPDLTNGSQPFPVAPGVNLTTMAAPWLPLVLAL